MNVNKILDAVQLLGDARRLNNQTVRDAREVEQWHRAVDKFFEPDDPCPEDRWDTPDRIRHRQFVEDVRRGS